MLASTRRSVLRAAALWLTSTAVSAARASSQARQPTSATDPFGGWTLGCQAYTFRKFSVLEAIEKTAQVGGRVIEFYPGQKLDEAAFDQNAPDAAIARVKEALARHNIAPVAFGVVGLPGDEAKSRAVFAFAKKMGIGTLVSEPNPNALDVIEKLVREYDIKVAIHNHPRRANDANYKIWDPAYVLSLVANRDKRIGACADTGHWVRSGLRPVDALQTLRGRVISAHLKDVDALVPAGRDVPFGTGLADVGGILDELRRQNFSGHLSLEYEASADNPVPPVAQCVGFIRGHAAARKGGATP